MTLPAVGYMPSSFSSTFPVPRSQRDKIKSQSCSGQLPGARPHERAHNSKKKPAPGDAGARERYGTPATIQGRTRSPQAVRDGLSTADIAKRFGVNKIDVQDWLRVAVRKLGAVNRVHAVALATDMRIIKVAGGRARQAEPEPESSTASDDIQLRIRERAYQIRLDEGKPHGLHREHWVQAEAEIRSRSGGTLLPENELFHQEKADEDR